MIKCDSSLTIYNVFDISEEWKKIFADEPSEITIDMSDLEEVDTAGAQVLLALQKECSERKCKLAMTGMKENVKSFFRLIGCNQLLD